MAAHVWDRKAQCRDCGGTGLYVGLAERDGAAIVCPTCKGTGCRTIRVEWEDFDGREIRQGVDRVFEVNPGICIGAGVERHDYDLADFGGMDYEDWENGDPFPRGSENRRFTCPAWWYQSADYKKKPKWDECRWGGTFSSCPHFHAKDACWSRWDKEFGHESS